MLTKQKKYDFKDSNIANIGSEMDKKLRETAAATEPAWQGVGKEVGIRIWRIEQFKVVEVPKDSYGSFFSGDSYIIINTYKKSPDSKALAHDLHFWLGLESSQDEMGTAAYKTVELDDLLKGVPVQHREVEGHESPLFMSYFSRFQTMDGGTASGFKSVKPEEYRSRLLHVKSVNKKMLVREVPLSHENLNSGDVFVLDRGLIAYQWNGSQSSGIERHKGGELLKSLNEERRGLVKTFVVDQAEDNPAFWEALGGKGPVASAEDGDKSAIEEDIVKRLFRLSDASGKVVFKKEAEGQVYKKHFDTKDVFIYDAGFELFVWIGKGASKNERRFAIIRAMEYLNEYKRPVWLPITRIMEGGENEVFESALDQPPARNFTIPAKK